VLTKWDNVLLAYLHDPPDKALSVNASSAMASHESRRLELAKAILGDEEITKKGFKRVTGEVDVLASIVERLPMPEKPNVNVKESQLSIRHPLSGIEVQLSVPGLNDQLVEKEKQQLLACCRLPTSEKHKDRNRFFAIWRRWSESLSEVDPVFSRLPAETRNPDHTIWNHLDTTAAFQTATVTGQQPAALLAFALGPVQRFIEASRSVRDLWSSSMILSWLAFRSLLPVIEELGPTAVVYPSLRGNPLLDLWLRKNVGLNDLESSPALRMTPCLPHRFLAIVPWGENGGAAQSLAQRSRQATEMAWTELASSVREKLSPKLRVHCADWDKRWDAQVDGCFQAQTSIFPLALKDDENDEKLAELLSENKTFAEAFPDSEAVREMIRSIPRDNLKGYRQDHAGRWQHQVELATRSLAAQRSIRHVPANTDVVTGNGRVPQKCSLFGSYEQMGPDDLSESTKFWDRAAKDVSIDGVHIRKGEALSAVALIKRFAAPSFLRNELDVQQPDFRFPDTYTVAAATWLQQAQIDWKADWWNEKRERIPWNGQWLHWFKPDQDKDEADPCPLDLFELIQAKKREFGAPPIYYVILKLDGDDLGSWLRGKNSPKVKQVLHSELVSYYESVGDKANVGLDARRPVSPALHAAISAALSNFALQAVPEIVAGHHGTTIYSGGDDTLVLLPTSTVLACANELRQAYMSNWYPLGGREHMMMGSNATISGGLVAVHAKDDLRLALQDARDAEKEAKEAGKDALCLRVRRRSGEHTSAICSWPFVVNVSHWMRQFQKGASDRWAYHLYAQRSTMTRLPVSAMQAEIRRQIGRAEEPTPTLIPPDQLAKTFDQLCKEMVGTPAGEKRLRFDTSGAALESFLTLCHTASFLARGRDQ